MKNTIHSSTEANGKLKELNERFEKQISDINSKMESKSSTILQLEREKAILDKGLNRSKDTLNEMTKTNADLKNKLSAKAIEVTQLNEAIAQQREEGNNTSIELNDAVEKIELIETSHNKLTRDIEALNTEKLELESIIKKHTISITTLKNDAKMKGKEIESYKNKIGQLEMEHGTLLENITVRKQDFEDKIHEQKFTIKNLDKQLLEQDTVFKQTLHEVKNGYQDAIDHLNIVLEERKRASEALEERAKHQSEKICYLHGS